MRRIENLKIPYYLLDLSPTSAPRAGDGTSLSEGFLERNVFHFKLRAAWHPLTPIPLPCATPLST